MWVSKDMYSFLFLQQSSQVSACSSTAKLDSVPEKSKVKNYGSVVWARRSVVGIEKQTAKKGVVVVVVWYEPRPARGMN